MFSRSDPAIQGIVRLLNDARLLLENRRNESAYVLALIGVEEMAKLIVVEWREIGCSPIPKRRSSHLTKQAVFTALLQSSVVLPMWETFSGEGPHSPETVASFTQFINDSPHAEKAFAANTGLLERMKQAALYVDRESRDTPEKLKVITLEDVNYFLSSAHEAILLMADRRALILGWALYTAATELPWRE